MVRRDVAERALEINRGRKPNRVSMGKVRSSKKINLCADITDIGICMYYAPRRTAYLAHLESKISSDKSIRAGITIEPLLIRLRKDKIPTKGIVAVILGDSVQTFEYGPNPHENPGNSLHIRRDHNAYRKSLEECLANYGIPTKNCCAHYATLHDSYIQVTLCMPEGRLQLRELQQGNVPNDLVKPVYLRF
jgi:hypothetical protein